MLQRQAARLFDVGLNDGEGEPPVEAALGWRPELASANLESVEVYTADIWHDDAPPVLMDAMHEGLEPAGCNLCGGGPCQG